MAKTALKTKPEPVFERLSQMQIAMRFGLHRQTVADRLEKAGITPAVVEPNRKLYDITPELKAAIIKRDETLDAVKLRDAEARTRLAEVKVEQITGETVRMSEAREVFAAITAKMYGELATQMPKRLAGRLAKAKSAAETSKILRNEVERVFQMLRKDPEGMLK